MKYENISFSEAAKIIGNEIGISIQTNEKQVVDKNKNYMIYMKLQTNIIKIIYLQKKELKLVNI